MWWLSITASECARPVLLSCIAQFFTYLLYYGMLNQDLTVHFLYNVWIYLLSYELLLLCPLLDRRITECFKSQLLEKPIHNTQQIVLWCSLSSLPGISSHPHQEAVEHFFSFSSAVALIQTSTFGEKTPKTREESYTSLLKFTCR